MPLPQLGGSLTRKQAAHLLRRATFGPTKAQIDQFTGLGAGQAVDLLFQNLPLPADPSFITAPPPAITRDLEGFYGDRFKGWWIGLMMGNGVSIREKIVFFLHTLITTSEEVVENGRALYYQNKLLRLFAFDQSAGATFNMKTLSKKICVDNAMLKVLDGRLNVRGNINENFARELLELYSIGRGLPTKRPPTPAPGDYIYFTEQDVRAAAEVLSGWDTNFFGGANPTEDTAANATFNTPIAGYYRGRAKLGMGMTASQHENKAKQFSARFQNRVIQGNTSLYINGQPTEASMLDEIDQLIEMIYAQDETALNICRRIYRFFVYHDITNAIDDTIIRTMANDFIANGFKIEPIIRDLLRSQHFYDAAAGVTDDNFGGIIKSPVDMVLSTLRFFEYPVPAFDTADFYTVTGKIIGDIEAQGLNFMNPFDIAGYEGYHQYPIYYRYWITTNTLARRYKFIKDTLLVEGAIAATDVKVNVLTYMRNRFPSLPSPDDFILNFASYILTLSAKDTEITTARYNYFRTQMLKERSLQNQDEPTFWAYYPNTTDYAKLIVADLINSILQSPEYQLM